MQKVFSVLSAHGCFGSTSLPQKPLSYSLDEFNHMVNAMQKMWVMKYPKQYSRPESKWIKENAPKIPHKHINFSEFPYSQSCRNFVQLAIARDYIKKSSQRRAFMTKRRLI